MQVSNTWRRSWSYKWVFCNHGCIPLHTPISWEKSLITHHDCGILWLYIHFGLELHFQVWVFPYKNATVPGAPTQNFHWSSGLAAVCRPFATSRSGTGSDGEFFFFAWLTWVLPHEIHSLMVVKIGFMVVNISCSPSFWGMNILLPDFFMFSRVPGVLSIAKDGCGIFSTFTGDSFAFMRCSGGSFASVEYLGSTLYLFIWCPLFDLGYKKRWKNLRGRDL